jgi:hypothetical protein
MSNKYMLLIGIGLLIPFLGGCGSFTKRATIDRESYTEDSLAENYWNNFRFCDSAENAAEAECCFSAYIKLLGKLPYAEAEKAENKLIRAIKLAPFSAYLRFMDMAEKYLYDPQSGFCDDELYRPFLTDAAKNKRLDEATRERLQYRLKINGRNRPGHPATDFSYETIDGKKGTLYGIQSKYILVYFNNPDCHDCKIVGDALKKNLRISRLISEDKLKILSVYPDRDRTAWKKDANDLPENWINTCDPEGKIKDDNIYDLKAIPTLYLLDRDKKVILKDPVLKKLINFFDNKD